VAALRKPSGPLHTDWQGSYFYVNPNTIGEPIQLRGLVDDGGRFQFSEFVEKGEQRNITGNFSGQFEAGRAKAQGVWNSPDGKRQLPFVLERVASHRERTAIRDFTIPLDGPDAYCPCIEPVKRDDSSCVCRAHAKAGYPVLEGAAGQALGALLEGRNLLDVEIAPGEDGEWPDAGESETHLSLALYSPPLLSLEHSGYYYAWGAAHGMHSLQGLNLLLDAAGKLRELELKDLVSGDEKCLGKINGVIKEALRKLEVPAVVEPDSWSADLTTLYDRPFLIRPGGLVFLFSPYDVAPYAAGILQAPVPFRAIAGCIPKDSPLAALPTAEKKGK
jgi:hypothetical protein